ncbi:MAG: DUF397 domain-containing protein [Mycobacterium sp.]|nr:DUF397 domain-containing protein [Mycobacterium sp.]
MTPYATLTWRKARRSGGNGNCVEVALWRKASRSGANGSCVEIRPDGETILIRDSKYLRDPSNRPDRQPIIAITTEQWTTFLDVVAGRSRAVTEPRITLHSNGSTTLTSADGVALDYTPAEWQAFSLGVIDGEFDDLAQRPNCLAGAQKSSLTLT